MLWTCKLPLDHMGVVRNNELFKRALEYMTLKVILIMSDRFHMHLFVKERHEYKGKKFSKVKRYLFEILHTFEACTRKNSFI